MFNYFENTQRISFYDHTYEKEPTVKDTPCSLTRCSLIVLDITTQHVSGDRIHCMLYRVKVWYFPGVV